MGYGGRKIRPKPNPQKLPILRQVWTKGHGSADLLLRTPAQSNSPAATRTGRAFVDELDPGSLQRGHDPCQTLDHPADGAVARFHALDRRERYPRCLRQGFLLHARKRPGRLHLGCSKQCPSPTRVDDMSGRRCDPPDGSRIMPDLRIISQASGRGEPNGSAGSWFHMNMLTAGMALEIAAHDGLLFLLAWEIMALSPFFLVVFDDRKAAVRHAGWTYPTATHLGTAFPDSCDRKARSGSRDRRLGAGRTPTAHRFRGASCRRAYARCPTSPPFLP